MHHSADPRAITAKLSRLPAHVQLLLFSQVTFNIGFYLVVPFLAVHMAENLHLAGVLVGVVLGVRTFSQQGMFFLGGGLADRWGIKPVVLIGVAIRVAGFIVTAMATNFATILLGVILIGFAAALFSPAVEAALAVEGRRLQSAKVIRRSELFALDTMAGRVGALSGPVLGALLMGIGFGVTSAVAATIFTAIFIAHLVLLPRLQTAEQEADATVSLLRSWGAVLGNGRFVVFAVIFSTCLVAYNQQYLLLPAELYRAFGSTEALGWFFAGAGFFAVAAQMPVEHVAAKLGRVAAVWLGFAAMAVAFALIAVVALFPPLPGIWGYCAVAGFMVFLHVGQMLALPMAKDLVGVFAGETNMGSYYGFLNTFGGIAVLIGSALVGLGLDAAETPTPAAAWPWLGMAVVLGLSAIGVVAMRRSFTVPAPAVEAVPVAPAPDNVTSRS